MKKAVYLIVTMLVLLSGCRHCPQTPSSAAPGTVTMITVTYDSPFAHIRRQYVASEKMRSILNYLRWIDPYGKPEDDPTKAEGSLFQIILHCSDGTETVYLQKADRYMKIDGGPWLTIDPDRALTLSQIVERMESDELTRSPSAP